MSYDIIAAMLIWASCIVLRYGVSYFLQIRSTLYQTTALALLIEFSCFAYFGLYKGFWRYASLHDVKQILKAIAVSALLVPLALTLWSHAQGVPRSLFLLNPLLLMLFMVGGRVAYRWWKEHQAYGIFRQQGEPLLLMGAGDSALKFLNDIERSPSWYVVGLLDDDRGKIGRNLAGVNVLGSWEDMPSVASGTGARHAILATATVSHAMRRRAFQICERAKVKLLVVPAVEDVISGRVTFSQLRHIEVDDLLGREPVELNTTGLRQWLTGRTVLITGAGGSIGSELCRQIARFAPGRIVFFDHDEFALYQVSERCSAEFPQVQVSSMIGDVRDARRVAQLFERHHPTLVFHAAAYKHVPLMETDNAAEAVINNVQGTLVLAEACIHYDVEKLVFISTDKAVNPTNVMGATKRLAEMMLQHLHLRDHLSVVMVRFGNVLGSTGSVIPKFREQIARGGPITVTHPEMLRYFMSVPEASQLVLQAGLMGQGGEVFVLDMGEPVRILELARDMIRLSGLTEDDIRIVFSGLRPGEKLFEELLADDETTLPTPNAKLRVQRTMEPPGPTWYRKVREWLTDMTDLPPEEVRQGLVRFVPEYKSSGIVEEPSDRDSTQFAADLPQVGTQ